MSETEEGMADDWAAALQEQQEAAQKISETRTPAAQQPEPISYDDLEENIDPEDLKPGKGDVNLDLLLDIPVMIAMEIGRTKINIRNLLQLTQGSVIELDRLAGEPMDVMVNGTLIAHGEVVVVNEKFGIRLTDVISPSERVKKLK